MSFVVPKSLTSVPDEVPKYVSGYTEEEEIKIKQAKALLDERDLAAFPVTLEEFKNVIVPWFRISRTEEFILHPEKVKKVRVLKEKVVKEKVIRVPKVKKLTKAQIQYKMSELVMKLAMKEEFTEEETEFFRIQTGG